MFLSLEGKKMYEEILDQMQELLKDEIENFGGDLGKLEETVMVMMMSFGKGLLQRVVDSSRNGYQDSSIPCGCGSSKKFIQHRPKDIHSLFGWIKLKRADYNCRDCGDSLAPYDVTSGYRNFSSTGIFQSPKPSLRGYMSPLTAPQHTKLMAGMKLRLAVS